ncbi:hypothetical protein LEP1GSC072_3979 [Leptospira noguchii str. Bonito]|nr:hypothetical protein LEP1GSC072_3979 [Leptospira noguchii str. Bonito]
MFLKKIETELCKSVSKTWELLQNTILWINSEIVLENFFSFSYTELVKIYEPLCKNKFEYKVITQNLSVSLKICF